MKGKRRAPPAALNAEIARLNATAVEGPAPLPPGKLRHRPPRGVGSL